MHFVTIAASAVALAGAASAAAVPTHRYAQLRLWGGQECATLNLGEEGIYGDQLAMCNPLDVYDTVRSVRLEAADAGCTLYIYSDLQCHLGKHEVPVTACLSGDKEYRSYELFCDV
ncbi:uncharacterized protein N7482_005604 [Penicillium canariense]|uniref:Uncharacterized protein n=1 Tax=Penicillium canariense TaxID=189055 RepID=A0A9W9LNL5_9EURO|nr:uncharacterized protein N7482_005604 [Penicillium canariense]KAJ5166823.1 hypothetical protein N7482_005604 [Penicillium canariense]